jgi:AraC-like DNA-binding protein
MSENLSRLNQKISDFSNEEGFTPLAIQGVGTFKASQCHQKTHTIYEPLICLVTQGAKLIHVGDVTYRYEKGDLFINVLPLPVISEVVEATDKAPMQSAAMCIDLVRLADMITKIERHESSSQHHSATNTTSIVLGQAPDELFDLFSKLLSLSESAMDTAILGESIVDEIYYRLLTSQYGSALRTMLNRYGQVQPISKAVGFIHENLDKPIQIHELANLSNMSKTTFFNAFKKLMHVPPIQYIKSVKLQKAQTFLKQGMQASEASYRVGYNSFSQFSREYKRLFGFPPSATTNI